MAALPGGAETVITRDGGSWLHRKPKLALLEEKETRLENDYGPAAARTMAEKRADYFACGTLVVWDVDVLGPDVIKSYQANDPEHPVIFRYGDSAAAESAVPGWRMAVDDLFG